MAHKCQMAYCIANHAKRELITVKYSTIDPNDSRDLIICRSCADVLGIKKGEQTPKFSSGRLRKLQKYKEWDKTGIWPLS